jgi:hypothetical protein
MLKRYVILLFLFFALALEHEQDQVRARKIRKLDLNETAK